MDSNICWVVVDNYGTVCGECIMSQPGLRRHMRREHPGCVLETDRLNTSTTEIAAGKNSVRDFVFCGAWRDMRFAKESDLDGKLQAYRDKKGNPAEQIFFLLNTCDEFEKAAEDDPVFAKKYGTRFHRAQRSMLLRDKPKSISKPIVITIDSDSDENDAAGGGDDDDFYDDNAPRPCTTCKGKMVAKAKTPTLRAGRSGARRASRITVQGSVAKPGEPSSSSSVGVRRSSSRRHSRIKSERFTPE